MRKSLYPVFLGIMSALFSLVYTEPTAFAAPRQFITAQRELMANSAMHHEHCYVHCSSVYNQYFHGDSYSHLHLTFHGNNLDNSGNQGYNSGRNMSYGANSGNLVVNHSRSSRYASINQHFSGNNYSHNTGYFEGHNLTNTGNQGYNRGYNANYDVNAGNLIVNQPRSGRTPHVNQYFSGSSYNWNRAYLIGHNQNNSGNQGVNRGVSEDNSVNGGNQIVN